MLTAKTALVDYVEADNATKGEEYLCRGCGKPVIFKPGRVVTKHFAHYPGSRCSFGALMSPEHLKAQRILADVLRQRGVQVEIEAVMNSLAGDRRIDVLAWPSDRENQRVAIEVQASDITTDLVEARTKSYLKEDVAPLWLRLYDFGKWADAKVIAQRQTIWIPKHHLRSWERWVYDHLGNRLWFMDSATFLLWRGTFVPAHSYVEYSSWYEAGGVEASAGDYWRDITKWVELELEGPFAPTELRLKRSSVIGPDKVRRRSAWFVPEGEADDSGTAAIRVEFVKYSGPFASDRQIQIRSGEVWRRAIFDAAPNDWRTTR